MRVEGLRMGGWLRGFVEFWVCGADGGYVECLMLGDGL